jgi:methyltransferase (TIGR00027 family)
MVSRSMSVAQGRLLAERMTLVLPALYAMVTMRTRHRDELVRAAVAEGIEQVVILGVGLDAGMLRLPIDHHAVDVFEVDFPSMIAARETLLATLPATLPYLPLLRRQTLALDLERENVRDRLLAETTFNPARPTLVIWGGMTMYLSAKANDQLLESLQSLLTHPLSKIWVDLVSRDVVNRTTSFPETRTFVENMQALGAPFVFGVDDPDAFFQVRGFRIDERASSDYLRIEASHPLYQLFVISTELVTG